MEVSLGPNSAGFWHGLISWLGSVVAKGVVLVRDQVAERMLFLPGSHLPYAIADTLEATAAVDFPLALEWSNVS